MFLEIDKATRTKLEAAADKLREAGKAKFRKGFIASRVRTGKTKKDRESGSWSSRFANRAGRVEWQNDRRAK